MKYICNRCGKIFHGEDITIHYITGENGLEIVAICKLCLQEYLDKTKADTDRDEEVTERMKMKRKW